VDLATILLIALGFAIDAFAVSNAHGMTVQNRRVTTGLTMAVSFGAF
jgi:putative Mn2+ efflux pump MntP